MSSETTKDKAGALPPAVYQMHPKQPYIPGQPLDFDGDLTTTIPTRGTKGMELKCTMVRIQATNVTAHGVSYITFVNDSEIRGVQMDQFESKSNDEEDVYLGSDDQIEDFQEVFHPVRVTRSGRRVRAFVGFV